LLVRFVVIDRIRDNFAAAMESKNVSSVDGSEVFDEAAMEANALFSRESFENQPTKVDRMRSKAKRIPRNGSDHNNGETLSDGGSAEPIGTGLSSSLGKKSPLNSALFTSKNHRRKRNLKGRGLPKKGFVWIVPANSF
jgi:hypothetical protein